MVIGKMSFKPQEKVIKVTVDIPLEEATPELLQELSMQFGKEVVVSLADETVMSKADEIHEARRALQIMVLRLESVKTMLEAAEAKLPLDAGGK